MTKQIVKPNHEPELTEQEITNLINRVMQIYTRFDEIDDEQIKLKKELDSYRNAPDEERYQEIPF